MTKSIFVFLIIYISIPTNLFAQEIDIIPVWTKIGDSYGATDVENEIESIEAAVFSPDERYIVSGAKKGWEVTLWKTKNGEKVWQHKSDEEVEVVNFTRDGRYIISGGEDKKVRIWEVSSGDQIKEIENIAGFDAMAVAHQKNLLALGDEAGQIVLIDTKTWGKLDEVQNGPDELTGAMTGVHADINQLQFTRDDNFLLSAGRNKEVKLWQVTPERKLLHVRTYTGHAGTVKSVRLSPDGKLVAAGAGNAGGVRIWDYETGQLVHHIPATGMIMETVEFTPDGKYLFTGGNEGEGKTGEPVENEGFENKDGMGHIRAYRLPDFKLVLEKPVFRQEYLDFSKDGKLLLTSHEDGTLRLWEVKRQKK